MKAPGNYPEAFYCYNIYVRMKEKRNIYKARGCSPPVPDYRNLKGKRTERSDGISDQKHCQAKVMAVLIYPPILGWSYLGLESGEINQVGVFHPVLTILADRVYGAQAI